MLDELSQLLAAASGEASRGDYAAAVLEGNCLGKRAAATRNISLQWLTEPYGLEDAGNGGNGPDTAGEVQPQIEAIAANRSLLAATDPVPDLARKLADALRAAPADAGQRHADTYDEEWQRLSKSESWRKKIGQGARDGIFGRLRIAKAAKGATGTEQEVLESLDRIPLDGWRTRAAALPRLFADARVEADRLVEPKTRHVKLESTTITFAEGREGMGGSNRTGTA